MVSGDSFLRGFHASPLSFSFIFSLWICHDGRSFDNASSNASREGVFVAKGFGGSARAWSDCRRRAAEKNRDGCEDRTKLRWDGVMEVVLVRDRMNRLSVMRGQALQFIVAVVAPERRAQSSSCRKFWRTDHLLLAPRLRRYSMPASLDATSTPTTGNRLTNIPTSQKKSCYSIRVGLRSEQYDFIALHRTGEDASPSIF